EMQVDDWGVCRALAMLVSGHGISERGPRGERLFDDDFLVLVNGGHDDAPTLLPAGETLWRLLLDTANPVPAGELDVAEWSEPTYPLRGRSVALLSRARPKP
ncbi:MAG: glycogen debranching enzyme GlgX, partial [Pseudomonadota bacterium]|nr:glycogen debranching enzyme GlgX [Pseudomonadota bacterium]